MSDLAFTVVVDRSDIVEILDVIDALESRLAAAERRNIVLAHRLRMRGETIESAADMAKRFGFTPHGRPVR